MKHPHLRGIIPIVQMPFDESDGVEKAGLAREAEWLLERHVAGIGFGYGSEIRRLTEQEIDEAVEMTVGVVSGEVPVVAPVASVTGASMARRARRMAELGADAVLAPAPSQSADQQAVLDAFSLLAESSDVAIVVQDAPKQTGVVLDVDTIVAIAELEPVIALKLEEPPTVPKIEAVIERLVRPVPVFGGAGGQDFFYELLSGVAGTMPPSAFPGLFVKLLTRFRQGDVDGARDLFGAILPLIVLSRRDSDTMCYTHKELLRRRGVLSCARLRGSPTVPRSLDRDLDVALELVEGLLGESIE